MISTLATTIISTIIGLILTRRFNKHLAKRDLDREEEKKQDIELATYREEELRKQRKVDTMQVVGEVIRPIKDSVEQINVKLDLLEAGTLSTLRNDILSGYYNCLEKGYRNDYDYQNLHHMYESYAILNGNSYVTDVMARFDALPTKEEFKELPKESEEKKKVKRGTLKVLPQNKEKETK